MRRRARRASTAARTAAGRTAAGRVAGSRTSERPLLVDGRGGEGADGTPPDTPLRVRGPPELYRTGIPKAKRNDRPRGGRGGPAPRPVSTNHPEGQALTF